MGDAETEDPFDSEYAKANGSGLVIHALRIVKANITNVVTIVRPLTMT